MDLDINKYYFLISFRFNKCAAQDYNLEETTENNYTFINKSDNSLWIKRELYDFGWGNECGFMRLPKLNFNQLWYLLINSKIKDNKYGSANIILEESSDKLRDYLIEKLEKPDFWNDKKIKETLKILKLNEFRNRDNIIGKEYIQIQNEFKQWELINQKVREILSL